MSRNLSYDQRHAPKYITRVLSEISPGNREVAERYIAAKRAAGLKLATCQTAAIALRGLDRSVNGKSLVSLTPDELNKHLEIYGRDKMPESIRTTAANLKAFYAWLNDGEAPRAVRNALKYKPTRSPERVPISEAEFRRLLEAANSIRMDGDRLKTLALIWTYWDSGMRSGEVLALRISSVRFHEDGGAELALPDVEGLKTGPRTIPVYDCVGALKAWIAAHPSKLRDPPLFPCRKDPDLALLRTSAYTMLDRVSKRAKLRTCFPHLFRHTRATRAAEAGWNNYQMNAYFGWDESSGMAAHYVHLSQLKLKERVMRDAQVDPLGARVQADPKGALVDTISATIAATLKGLGVIGRPPQE